MSYKLRFRRNAIIAYDPQLLSPKRISQGTATSTWLLAYVIPEPGKIKIYIAGTKQPEKEGPLLDIYFDSVSSDLVNKPSIVSIQINAGKTRAILENLPISTALLQNYPNPCNPGTWIPYKLISQTEVIITIYNASGKVIRQLDLGTKMAGHYVDESRAAYWDGRNEQGEEVASGIYFYSINCNDFSSIKKMTIKR